MCAKLADASPWFTPQAFWFLVTVSDLFRFDRTDSNWGPNISNGPTSQLPEFYRSRTWLDFEPDRLELVITLVESLLVPLCLNVLLQTWPSSPCRRLPKPPCLSTHQPFGSWATRSFNHTTLLAFWAARSLAVAGCSCSQKQHEAAAGEPNGFQGKSCKGAAQLCGGKPGWVPNAFIRPLEA